MIRRPHYSAGLAHAYKLRAASSANPRAAKAAHRTKERATTPAPGCGPGAGSRPIWLANLALIAVLALLIRAVVVGGAP